METKQRAQWQRVTGSLISRLRTDVNNDLMRCDPWSMAATSMVNGWQIRLSRPPAKGNTRIAPRPTWKVFARRGVGILSSKRYHAKRNAWHQWASRRVTAGSRYIRKSKRTW